MDARTESVISKMKKGTEIAELVDGGTVVLTPEEARIILTAIRTLKNNLEDLAGSTGRAGALLIVGAIAKANGGELRVPHDALYGIRDKDELSVRTDLERHEDVYRLIQHV